MADEKKPRLTLEQKIARQEQALARLKTQQAQRSRKVATREKIIVGAVILERMRHDESFRAEIVLMLDNMVKRELDREVIAGWLQTT